jgi:GTP cyclohydrolase I
VSRELPDVQNTIGDYKFALKAGIAGVKMPIKVKDLGGNLVPTVATVNMYTRLPKTHRGINMSRLPIILSELHKDHWVLDDLQRLLQTIMDRLESDAAHVTFEFPYFYTKAAPVTGHEGLAYVYVKFDASKTLQPGSYDFLLTVKVATTTLCPCSKEISGYSAHNQRCSVEISVKYEDFVWIEQLIEIAEISSSCTRYPILKREDEKYVTEQAYDNPRFVEDVARGVAEKLTNDRRIKAFKVTVISEESIHQHDAVAEISVGMEDVWQHI